MGDGCCVGWQRGFHHQRVREMVAQVQVQVQVQALLQVQRQVQVQVQVQVVVQQGPPVGLDEAQPAELNSWSQRQLRWTAPGLAVSVQHERQRAVNQQRNSPKDFSKSAKLSPEYTRPRAKGDK
jgi:hypothetical protein